MNLVRTLKAILCAKSYSTSEDYNSPIQDIFIFFKLNEFQFANLHIEKKNRHNNIFTLRPTSGFYAAFV